MCDYTPVIVYQTLCGNVSKSLKKVQIVRLQFSSYKLYWGKRDAKPRPPVRDRGNAKVQFGVKDSFFSWFNKSIQILAKQWKICHLFLWFTVRLTVWAKNQTSELLSTCAVPLCQPGASCDWAGWVIYKKKKKQRRLITGQNANVIKFQHISRFSYRTLTSAEFRSSLQHCSPAITDALLRLWPPHSHFLRPLWCTGSLTVCGLQTGRGNARPHLLQVWDPS